MGCGASNSGQPREKNAPQTEKKTRDKPENKKKFDVPTPGSLARENAKYLRSNPSVTYDKETGLPEPMPPKQTKEEVFKLEDYRDIDRHAVQAPSELANGSFEELIEYLLRFAKTDMQKARVIFRWIAAQDLSNITESTGVRKDTPRAWLKDCKLYWKDYFELTQKLFDTAGIPCKTLKGRLKAAQYKLGQEETMVVNGWNAVLIDEQWWLINVRWACVVVKDAERPVSPTEFATHKKAEARREQAFYGRCDEKFWLCNPNMLVFTHLPDEPKWQLCAAPVSMDQFTRMAWLRSEFFEHELDIETDPLETIVATNGVASFQLRTKQGTMKSFNYRLVLKEGQIADRYNDKYSLDRFVLLEQVDEIVSFEIRCPAKGTYQLEIYCKNLKSDEHHTHVMTYRIICHSAKVMCRPFPNCAGKEWGPGHYLAACNISPLTTKYAKIDVEEGFFEIKFRLPENDTERDFFHSLVNNDQSQDKLKNYTLHSKHGNEVSFYVKMPEPGEYGLNIHVKDRKGHRWLLSYLLETKVGALDPRPYPKIDGNKTGITSAAKQIGFEPVGHEASYFYVNKEHTLNFKYSEQCKFTHHMNMASREGDTVDYTQFCQMNHVGDRELRLDFRFPRLGVYQYRLYGQAPQLQTNNKKLKNQSDQGTLLAVYVFDCAIPDVGVLPYAATSPEFSQQGFVLIQPLDNYLLENTNHTVIVEAKNTNHVLRVEREKQRTRDGDIDEGWSDEMDLEGKRYTLGINSGPPGRLKLMSDRTKSTTPYVSWVVVTEAKMEQMLRKANEEHKREMEQLREAQRRQKLALDEMMKQAKSLIEEQEQQDDEQKEQAEAQAEKAEEEYNRKWDRMNQSKDQRRKAMRTRLRKAIIMNDKKKLVAEILEYKTLFGENCGHEELTESENYLLFMDCRAALEKARHGGRYTQLKIAMDAVVANRFEDRLATEMRDAAERLSELEEIHKLGTRVLHLEPRTLYEVKNYERPAVEVHEILICAMLLLGVPEAITDSWKTCRTFVVPYGPNSLLKKVENYDQNTLTGEIWARVQELIKPIQKKGGEKYSAAVTAIFFWVIGVQLMGEKKFSGTNPVPARDERQIEIFEELRQQQAEREREAEETSA